jgi:lipopolysaccharide biosynthesis glycosyltransferase
LKDCPIRPGEHVSLATYIRLFLPSILPQNIDKILYIDGDVICTDSIQDLWETPLANYAAAAVPDMRSNDIRILNRLSLPKDSDYFNAGIMLINLKWWRENDIQNKTLHYIANNKDICQYHDQDALNVLLHGQIAELPIRYNLQEHFFEPLENQFISRSHFEELQTALFNPSLIHYTGFRKPWHRECVNPLKSVWLFFYNKTEWRNTKLGFRHKGFRLFKYRLREKIANYGLMTSKNIYKDMDFSDIQQAVMNNVKSRVK